MTSIFRDNVLAGQVAVITGGTSGIGFGIAEEFARHGARLVLVGRNAEKAEAARRFIHNAGGEAVAATADVRDYGALERIFEHTASQFGPIDIVVAGAAGNFPAPARTLSANGFKAVIDIDLLGTFNTLRAAYAHLKRPGASLLAITAAQATVPLALQSHVCAAKAGVDLLVKTLAIEWGSEGVRCNCLVPGPTANTEGMRRLAPDRTIAEQARQSIPLRRFGTVDELAEVALFLCSPAAAYITGAALACDGGSALTVAGWSLGSVPQAIPPDKSGG